MEGAAMAIASSSPTSNPVTRVSEPGSRAGWRPLRHGDLLRLTEENYKFGVGPLTIRVDRVLERVILPDGVWVRVRGECKRAPTDAGASREVYLRESALRRRPT